MEALTWADKDKTLPTSNIRRLWREEDIAELKSKFNSNATEAAAHAANTSNPHGVTKAQVGLSAVNNTSDADKPISTAQQTALDLKLAILNLVVNVPAGTINGSNFNFTLADNPSVMLLLFADGIALTPTLDYSRSGTSLTLVVPPSTAILALYIK